MRKQVAEATSLFKNVANGKTIHFMDIAKSFLEPDGTVRPEIMPDFLHLSEQGYNAVG